MVIENTDQLSTNVTFNAKGNYTVAISVSDGALTTQAAVTVFIGGVGVDQMLAPTMLIYPNPAIEKLTLELINMPGNTSIISIYNITGSVVFNTKLSSEVIEIDISAFDAGLYFIKVNSGNRTFTQRVEIQN